MRQFKRLVCFLILASLASGSAYAGTFSGFVKDLVHLHFPALSNILIGVGGIRETRFGSNAGDGAAASYLIDSQTILLHERLQNHQRELKRVEELGPGDSSVVIHELWHSYFWNHFRRDRGAAYEQFVAGSRLYRGKSARIREAIHEEGYALFIQEVTRAYLQTYSLLLASDPTARERLKANLSFTRPYEQAFTRNYFGYHQNRRGEVLFSEIPISEADKASILRFFFHGRLTGKFAVDFAAF